MIQSIDRAARVLSLLQGARRLGISELATALNLSPSTVHGIVKSLQSHGLVEQESGGSRYVLGPALLKLSSVYLDTLDVRSRAMRWTQELSRRTGLAVRLAVPLGNEVIVIHHNVRPDGTEQMPETGMAIPSHASALGKVLLAYDAAATTELLKEPLRPLTGDTIADPAKLVVQLAQIAERAVATEEDEAVLGESSIAVPIASQDGSAVAALSLVMPSQDWPTGAEELGALQEAARNISRELGSASWPPQVRPKAERELD